MIKTIILNGTESTYTINENGDVINTKTNKKLKGSVSRSGYHYTRLSQNGKKYRFFTHVLVAEYFLAKPIGDKYVVNHKDGNKMNNNVQNLEYITQSENVKHAHKYGLIKKPSGEKINVKDLQNEIWVYIDDYPDYQVSNYGRVKSLKYNKERILKPSTVNGYYLITLSKNNKTKNFLVHRLVYYYFIDKQIENFMIDHIDNNPLNNYYLNLRKATVQENVQYALYEQGAFKHLKNVIAYKDGEIIGEYTSCAEAARALSCDSSAISKVCRGLYKHTHGYVFKYKE